MGEGCVTRRVGQPILFHLNQLLAVVSCVTFRVMLKQQCPDRLHRLVPTSGPLQTTASGIGPASCREALSDVHRQSPAATKAAQ